MLALLFSCSEDVWKPSGSPASTARSIIDDAKFSYHTKFNGFYHYGDFLSNPHWDKYFLLCDNDTVISLGIPFEDVGKYTRSYLIANQLKSNDSLFYYIRIIKKERKGSRDKSKRRTGQAVVSHKL